MDSGAVVGQTYAFLHFGSLVGFNPADFTVDGLLSGSFTLAAGALAFTVSAVPKPSVGWLTLASGTLVLAGFAVRRHRRWRHTTSHRGRVLPQRRWINSTS